MQIIIVKRLGPGKFYLSNKKQFGFIGGNPSSHKGWMSRYFFVKRIYGRENPWNCDMSWRDDANTLPPPTPEQKPDLDKFLGAVGDRFYDAQQLIEEDLLYDRMDKAAMLEALKERKTKTKSGGPPARAPRARRRGSPPQREKRGAKSAAMRSRDPEQQTTETPYTLLDTSTISFVSQPSGPVSLNFIRQLVPKQDFDQLKKTSDLGVFEAVGLHFMQSLAWFGEAASRFSKARAEVIKTKRSYDKVLGHHEALLKQLEDIQTKEKMERESLSAELELARAEVQTLKAQAQIWRPELNFLRKKANSIWPRLDLLYRVVPTKFGLGVPTKVGLMCLRRWPVWDWTLVPIWSGLCSQVGLPPEEVLVRNLALIAELVGLMRSSGVATRGGASAELGFEWPVRNWTLLLRWGCHPRTCQCGTGLRCRAGRAYIFA
ncbi:hypothetical protein F511_03514 [Dorcoceras hygrometricum]|uniref:Uncharacterized protein n=1 Tax=Dorcoceras hygrometricum TaxID=472368 RepID=A0A2Z7AA82_9LAMI|nr:hypothetical protein F511_03514 [Dorcoceras hygrometricum]